MSDDREMTKNEWATQQHINVLTADRDRYRDAVRAIGELAWCENCAPGYNLIVSALLDGEG